jgi:hypothetical protein
MSNSPIVVWNVYDSNSIELLEYAVALTKTYTEVLVFTLNNSPST